MLIKKKPVDDKELNFSKMGAKPKKFDPSDEKVKANLGKKSKKTAKKPPTKKTAKTNGKAAAFAQKAAMALASKG